MTSPLSVLLIVGAFFAGLVGAHLTWWASPLNYRHWTDFAEASVCVHVADLNEIASGLYRTVSVDCRIVNRADYKYEPDELREVVRKWAP